MTEDQNEPIERTDQGDRHWPIGTWIGIAIGIALDLALAQRRRDR